MAFGRDATGAMLTAVTHGTVLVEDTEDALEWYTKSVGMGPRADDEFGPGMRWVTVPTGERHRDRPPGADPAIQGDERAAELRERIGQGTVTVLATDDGRATVAVKRERGVTITSEPETVSWGLHANVIDRYGNPSTLVESTEASSPLLDVDDFDVELERLAGELVVEVDACGLVTDLDDGPEGPLLALDLHALGGLLALEHLSELLRVVLDDPLIGRLTVGLIGRERDGLLVAGLHPDEGVVEAVDDAAAADLDGERTELAVRLGICDAGLLRHGLSRRVEDRSVLELAGILDGYSVAV